MLRLTLLPAATLAVLALSAGAASAAAVTYDVTIDATVAYDHAKHSESHSGSRDYELDTSTHLGGTLRATLPGVRFVDGQVEESGGATVEEAFTGRSLSVEEDSWVGTTRLECLADGKPSPYGRASIVPAGFPGSGHLAVRLTDRLEVTGQCDDGRSPGYTIANLDGDVDDPTGGPFDAVFDLPSDALGKGLIAQLTEGAVEGRYCPGFEEGLSVSCKLSWSATISFVRSDLTDTVDPLKQPPPPATGTNDTLGQNAADVIARELERQRREREQQQRADDAKVDAVSKAVKDYLDRERIADTIRKVLNPGASGSSANVDLSCPGACTGSVTVKAGKTTLSTAPLRALGRSSAAKAKGTYGVRAKLRFDRADRRAAKRAGKVTLTFAVRVGTGKVQRAATTVKLKR